MLTHNPTNDWRRLGKEDPHYGVLSSERNRKENLSFHQLEEFFLSGEHHFKEVLRVAEVKFSYQPSGKALDFGCGVGRVSCAMASHFSKVIAVDISDEMLEKARQHAADREFSNIAYLNSGSSWHVREGEFDFIHSYIVLQHMTRSAGEEAIRTMLHSLREGGFGAIHLTYGHVRGIGFHKLRELIKLNRATRALGNVCLGRPISDPVMLMTPYNIPRILNILAEHGIEKFYLHRVDDWGYLGLFLFFMKGTDSSSSWSNPIRS